MADNDEHVEKCGKTTIRYPVGCVFVCHCDWNHWAKPCWWGVGCQGWITTGETSGRESDEPPADPPRPPHMKIVGPLGAAAKVLEKRWDRTFTVPRGVDAKTIVKRTFRGKSITPEKVADALGLKLGPVR